MWVLKEGGMTLLSDLVLSSVQSLGFGFGFWFVGFRMSALKEKESGTALLSSLVYGLKIMSFRFGKFRV